MTVPSQRRMLSIGVGLLLSICLGSSPRSSVAQTAPGALHLEPSDPSLAERRSPIDPALVPEVLYLPPAEQAAAAELEALRSQRSQAAPGVPYRIGFARNGAERAVELPAGAAAWAGVRLGELRSTAPSTVSWRGRFVVEEAHAVRILLGDLVLPDGGRIWVDAGGARFGPYGRELLDPEGNLWLPPVPGPEAVVEIELPVDDEGGAGPASPLRFTLGRVMELVEDPATGGLASKVWSDCDVDATCIEPATLSTIDQLRQAVARLVFTEGSFTYLCTGGLLNDFDDSSVRPFLLTANHCFDTQVVASSLVAYFDYFTDSCNGTAPSLASIPSVAGSTLLATSPDSDFTFVELSSNPTGASWYLGWTTARPDDGTTLYRVSHPGGTPQKYSESVIPLFGFLCGGAPTSHFLYTETTYGVTGGGSSGAPLTQTVDGDARVVGQLFAACYGSGFDDCDYSSYNDVDGLFGMTYPSISQWLARPPWCADAFEPDDSDAESSEIVSGEPQNHSLCFAGDEDWASFVLGDESGVVIETSGLEGDTVLWLYEDPLYTITVDDNSGTDLFSRIERSCDTQPLPAGAYFVQVHESGGDDEIGGYTLAFTRTESCSGTCPNDVVLSNTTLNGTESHRAHVTITLGPSLTVDGTAIDVLAGQSVVFESGTAIGGSFSAGTHPEACGQ